MPIHPDFQKVKANMEEQYGKDKGEGVYYAWLKSHGYDDTRGMPQRRR